MTTPTPTGSSAIDPDPTVAVTPSLGPVPAIYVSRRLARRGTSPSLWRAARRLVHHIADRTNVGA